MKSRHLPVVIWIFLLVLGGVYVSHKLSSEGVIETNLLKLLPEFEQTAEAREAVAYFSKNTTNKVFFAFSHHELELRDKVADNFAESLEQSPYFVNARSSLPNEILSDLKAVYFPSREGFLSYESQSQIEAGEVEKFFSERVRKVYSPVSVGLLSDIDKDPLLIYPSLLLNLAQAGGGVVVRNGRRIIETRDQEWILVDASLASSSLDSLGPAGMFLDELSRELSTQYPKLLIEKSQIFRFTERGSQSVRNDVELIGSLSLVGILLLMFLFFRSWRYLCAVLIAIGSGVLTALLAVLIVFESVYLLTLGFGVSLLGISVDYAFHYFSEKAFVAENDREVLRSILPGITFGLITSVVAYIALSFAPLPILKQLATFSAFGLLGAFVSVIVLFPYMKLPCRGRSLSRQWVLSFGSLLLRCSYWRSPLALLLAVGLCIASCVLTLNLKITDDIRLFQSLPKDLLQSEQGFRTLLSQAGDGRFFVALADNEQEMLESVERLNRELQKLAVSGQIESFRNVSQFLPSCHAQSKSKQMLQTLQSDYGVQLQAYFTQIGLQDSQQNLFKKRILSKTECLTLSKWRASGPGMLAADLLYQSDQGWIATIIPIQGKVSDGVLSEMAERQGGVFYLNKVKQISDYFSLLRQQATYLVVIGYGFILVLLLLRYGIGRGLLVFAPPSLSALFVLAFLSLTGLPFNLFSVLGLILVMGIGIDFSIFLTEAKHSREDTFLAIFMSACTTVLTFGLLAFSSTAALASFGCVVSIGVLISALLAPTLGSNG